MRTIIKEEIIYSWEDVKNNPEFLEKVLDKHRDINIDYDWWDFIYDDFAQENKYFNVKDMYFSGFWSQGDGAMFEYNYIDDRLKDEFIDSLNLTPMRKKWLINNANFYGKGKHSGRYYHENSCDHNIGCEVDNGDILYGTNFRNWIESFDDLFSDFVIDRYKDMCLELYNKLSKTYDYLQSDQSVCDTLEANDYEFDEQGNII